MKRWDKYKIELPKSRHEAEEFGRGKKGMVMCKECRSVYYKKSWRHGWEEVKPKADKDYPVKFVLCPACAMVKNKQFEGELKIIGAPETRRKELINLIKNFGKRAYERDPLDRLIEIQEKSSALLVTTTENQLAQKLARKIKDAFKRVKTKTSYSPEPSDVVYIEVVFELP